ncbi:N-6 DNA methylase, partial [Escherichia coli]
MHEVNRCTGYDKQGGQFYTPKSIVSLLVNMLEPYKG